MQTLEQTIADAAYAWDGRDWGNDDAYRPSETPASSSANTPPHPIELYFLDTCGLVADVSSGGSAGLPALLAVRLRGGSWPWVDVQ